MREIKFRAWNKEERKMVDLFRVTPLAIDATLHQQICMKGGTGLFIPFLPELEIMQFTGLKDRNCKEIYEGDILKLEWHDTPVKVVWSNRGWWLLDGEFDVKSDELLGNWITKEYTEIIGNIYESPELLA